MGHVTSCLLGGFAAVASWAMVAPSNPSVPNFADAFRASGDRTADTVVRSSKGDRWATAAAQKSLPDTDIKRIVTSIEVVGVDDTAIVYRDRDGNVLYRTDPVRNVTVIAKGVKLPEVTVRQDGRSATTPVPVNVPEADKPTKLPIGCEPAASPIAAPEMARLTGRCLAQADIPTMR
jgi:hypothetical protein